MRESSDQFGFLETGEDLDIAAIFGRWQSCLRCRKQPSQST